MKVSVEPCEKHETSGCVDCLPRPPRHVPDPSDYGPEFEARYPGRCALDKSHDIESGDMIRADGDGGYVCHRTHV